MLDKVCLVTGGTSGVGWATALGLAGLGAEVVLLSRDAARGEEAARQIAARTHNPRISVLQGDLGSIESIRGAAEEMARRHRALHVLVEAAGVLSWRRELSADGFERTFAVNCLGHFLLARLLQGPLQAGAPARVLAVSGGPSILANARLDVDGLPRGPDRYNPIAVTVQVMLAKVLTTLELGRRAIGTGVTANAFSPGLVRSRFDRGLPAPLRMAVRLVQPFLSSTCPTALYAATALELESASGVFLARSRTVPFNPTQGTEVRDRLWSLLEGLVAPFERRR